MDGKERGWDWDWKHATAFITISYGMLRPQIPAMTARIPCNAPIIKTAMSPSPFPDLSYHILANLLPRPTLPSHPNHRDRSPTPPPSTSSSQIVQPSPLELSAKSLDDRKRKDEDWMHGLHKIILFKSEGYLIDC